MKKADAIKTQKPSRNSVIAALVELEYQKQYKDYELALKQSEQFLKDYASLVEKEMIQKVRSIKVVSAADICTSIYKSSATAGIEIRIDLSPECVALFRAYQDANNKAIEPMRYNIKKEIELAMKGRMTGTIEEQANLMLADKNTRADLLNILNSLTSGSKTLLISQ
jgi:hypothetical protein